MEKVIIGNATLYCGDCSEILPQLEPADLLLTDPPYGIDAANYKRANTQHGKSMAICKDYGVDGWDKEKPPAELFLLLATKAKEQIIWGGNYFGLPASRCWLVWDKDNGANMYADCELAWTNLRQAVRIKKYKWQGMLQENMKNKEIRVHPTQKPVPVMEWCLYFVPDAVTVLDPFMGSGTTGVACHNMGKCFIGIEREQKYFDIACKRIEQAQSQMKMFTQEKKEYKQTSIFK